MHDRLQAKIHSRSVPAGGIFAFRLMSYYGQRSKFADLLNSYHYFTISSLFCTYDLFPAPQAGHPPTPTVPSYDDLSSIPHQIFQPESIPAALSTVPCLSHCPRAIFHMKTLEILQSVWTCSHRFPVQRSVSEKFQIHFRVKPPLRHGSEEPGSSRLMPDLFPHHRCSRLQSGP